MKSWALKAYHCVTHSLLKHITRVRWEKTTARESWDELGEKGWPVRKTKNTLITVFKEESLVTEFHHSFPLWVYKLRNSLWNCPMPSDPINKQLLHFFLLQLYIWPAYSWHNPTVFTANLPAMVSLTQWSDTEACCSQSTTTTIRCPATPHAAGHLLHEYKSALIPCTKFFFSFDCKGSSEIHKTDQLKNSKCDILFMSKEIKKCFF